MTDFQHVGVLDRFGPHVTLMAGVDLAGRYWSTTSTSAAKARAVRRDARTAVLTHVDDAWSLVIGSATLLDVRRPVDGLADPIAVGLAGIAVARLGLTHPDQIAGYLADRDGIPAPWRPRRRVLLVVRPEHHLAWDTSGVREASRLLLHPGRLPSPTRRRRHPIAADVLTQLPAPARRLLVTPRRCALGLISAAGPIVLPGHWDPAGTVTVDAHALSHLGAVLPGRCAVTVDDSDDPRPSAKTGVMLRGDAALLARNARTSESGADVAIRVSTATSWAGFESVTRRAG